MVEGYIKLAEARASQADLLERTVPAIAAAVADAAASGKLQGESPVLLGIGASFAAAATPVWLLRERGIDASRLDAGEYPVPFPASGRPVVGISQSGRSTETLAVLRSVAPLQRIAVANVVPSPMSEAAGVTIGLGNLPDSYASTTGFTATIAALAMLAEAWNAGSVDPAWAELAVRLRAFEAALAPRLADLAARLVEARCVDFAVTAATVGSAEVGALLLREIARIPAAGFSTRRYLHGAMESAGGTAHVLSGGARELGVAQTLARAGHEVILLTAEDVAEEARLSVVSLPVVPLAQRAILEAVALQGLAVEAALHRGLDPDAFVFFHTDTKVA